MVPVFIFGVLVRVRILFISSPGPDFIYLESGSGFYRCSPGPDCINDEVQVQVRILSITSPDFVLVRLRILSIFESGSESGIYQASPGPCPGPAPDFIRFESWSGFYQAGPGPRPDSTNTRPGSHLGHVWII